MPAPRRGLLMALYRDAAIVIRTWKLGEADRIVSLVSRQHGKIRAVAKGIRRSKSKFGARLEPGMIVDLQCYEGRNLDTITQVEILAAYAEPISTDYDSWLAAQRMLSVAERLTEEGQPAVQQFTLLAGGLAALATLDRDPALVRDSYLLRAMGLAGWAPNFEHCAKCGAPGPHRALDIAAGGVLCPDCRGPASVAVSTDAVTLLGALLAGDWERANASPALARHEASRIVGQLAAWHL